MKPLICFYKNEKLIQSTDYALENCRDSETVFEFLQRMLSAYPAELKIVQVNFEFDNAVFAGQKKLYSSAKACVFVLKEFSEITSLPDTVLTPPPFTALESEEGFVEKVNRIRQYIAQGRVYQVNLTAPLQATCKNSGLEIFSHYTKFFSGRYRALLPLAHAELVCFSPEMFLEKISEQLCTRPIKGSLAHALDFNEHLLENKKEEAELSMIVDLLRNDLNRLEENEKAVVTAHRAQMQLGYIQHTYSEVSVKTRKTLPEILQLTLPGGSISGCPKAESLKMISEFEPYARQAYTGCLGWWEGGDFCLNLTIRSFIKDADNLFYHAGCGIVYDSDPKKEWKEFLLKTGSLNVK